MAQSRLSPLVEMLEIFVVRVNAAVIAPGGFAGNAKFGQVFEGRGHRRDAEFQFLARTGNREDRLGLEQPVNAQGGAGGFANGLNAFLHESGAE